GQPAHGAGRRHLVVDLLPRPAGRDDLHRAVPAGGIDERAHRPAQRARPERAVSVLAVVGLRAWYRTGTFGVPRDVRAVDDVSFAVEAGEIYGLAGESSSGKTTLIKTI